MTFAQETNVLFGLAILLFIGIVFYMYNGAQKMALDNYCFQRTRMHIARMLKDSYSSELGILMNNMSKDLTMGRTTPYAMLLKKFGDKYFGDTAPKDGLLDAQEQAKVMTWLLNHETYPEAWKVKKIRLYRTMPELIMIAKAQPDATQNEAMAALLAY